MSTEDSQNPTPDDLDQLGLGVLQEYNASNDPSFLDQAVTYHQKALGLRGDEDPVRGDTLFYLADSLVCRYWHREDAQDLEAAIENHRKALALRPVGHPARIMSLGNLAPILVSRYRCSGNVADLDEAIDCNRATLELCTQGHESRWMALYNLGLALKNRFAAAGDRENLEEAVTRHREALALTPPGHPSRQTALNGLGTIMSLRYEHFGSKADLDESIRLHRATLELRPPGHHLRSRSLTNLGIVLSVRYELTGDREDISSGIELLKESLIDNQDAPSAKALIHTELGNGFLTRYARLGDPADLEESIRRHQEALELRPAGNSERSKTLCNLARTYQTRYFVNRAQSKDVSDLEAAIERLQEAVRLCPTGHPLRSDTVQTLADCLVEQFYVSQKREDLDHAISLFKEAFGLMTHTSQASIMLLSAFARALRARFENYKDPADLDRAIQYYEESFAMSNEESPSRAKLAKDLSDALVQRLPDHPKPGSQEWETMSRAISLMEIAARMETAPFRNKWIAARNWVKLAIQVEHPSLASAYKVALQNLTSYVTVSSSVVSQHTRLASDPVLRDMANLPSDAAAYALLQGDGESAVEILEQGRQLILNQLIRYRTPIQNLKDVDPDLAESFLRLSEQMELAVSSEGPSLLLATSGSGEDRIARFDKLSAEWSRTVDRIRGLDGFENFLRQTPYRQLREAAAEGPVILVNISRFRSDALIILPGDQRTAVISLPKASPSSITTLSEQLRNLVAERPDGITTKLANILREIWDIMVMPITVCLEKHLNIPRRSRVWWCLTSATWLLPVHGAGSYKPGSRNFADRYISSYTPSLSALLRLRQSVREQKSDDVLRVPRLLVIAMPKTPGEVDLPSVREEVHHIESVVKNATILQEGDVTKQSVLANLKDHPWVHFACHGHQDHEHAFNSHFSLQDSQLSLLEIIRSTLHHAELAVLSACHSAEGDWRTPDEAVHLAAGMQFVGFKNVVGTLWAMDDEEGPMVAEEFYKSMCSGDTGVADANRSAQSLSVAVTALRRRKVPLERWINFVHYGP